MIAKVNGAERDVELLEEGTTLQVVFLGGEGYGEVEELLGDGVVCVETDDAEFRCDGIDMIAVIRANDSDFWTGKRVVAVLRNGDGQ